MAFPRSGTVDTQTFSGTKDFLYATISASQSSNIGSGDHLKFDTISVSRPQLTSLVTGAAGGAAVTLDTATSYVNTNGTASIGRFTLRGGKVYKIDASPGYILFSTAAGLVILQWADVTGTPVLLGSPLQFLAYTSSTNDFADGDLSLIYQPGGGQNDQALLELRIIGAPTNLTSFGSTTKGLPTVLIETF